MISQRFKELYQKVCNSIKEIQREREGGEEERGGRRQGSVVGVYNICPQTTCTIVRTPFVFSHKDTLSLQQSLVYACKHGIVYDCQGCTKVQFILLPPVLHQQWQMQYKPVQVKTIQVNPLTRSSA